jgi:hypothetical protein
MREFHRRLSAKAGTVVTIAAIAADEFDKH